MARTSKQKNTIQRSESGLHGKQYERKILTLISLKCLLNKRIKDFWLLSNPRNVEKFDDLILLTEYENDRKQLFMVQIKHKLKGDRPIVALKLDSEDKNFGLEIYQQAYKAINSSEFFKNNISPQTEAVFILYNNCQVTTSVENDNIMFESISDPEYFDFIDSSAKLENILKVKNKREKYDNDFLAKFYFYTNQINESEVDNEIAKLFGGRNEIAERLTNFFFKWTDPRNATAKLHKIDIQTFLLEIIMGDFHPISCRHKIRNKVMDIADEFDVTIINEKYSYKAMWTEILDAIRDFYEDETIDLISWENSVSENIEKTMSNSLFKYSQDFVVNRRGINTNISTKTLFLVMVCLSKIPYFISTENNLFNIFTARLLPLLNIKIVIYNVKHETLQFNNLKVCNMLHNLDDKIYLEKSSKIEISFRGKTTQDLSALSKPNHAVIKEYISMDHIYELSREVFQIGESRKIPGYYINRQFNIPVLKDTVLKELEPIFIIMKLMSSTINVVKKYEPVDILSYIDLISSEEYDEFCCNILISSFSIDETLNLIKEHIGHRKLFLVRELPNTDNILLQLVHANCSVDILKPYLTTTTKKDDDIITDKFSSFGINIICNIAGMGKSTFLNFLYNRLPAEEWVFYMDLEKYNQVYRGVKTLEELFGIIFQQECRMVNPILRGFLKVLYDHWKNKMIWLIDGYDDINQPHLLNVFKDAINKGIRIWIVTRSLLKMEIEDKFNVFSIELTELTKQDQTLFFQKYLSQNNKMNVNTTTIMTIDKTRNLFEDSFIGICQQTVIFAEIYMNNVKSWEKISHRIDDLYEQFLNVKVRRLRSKHKGFYIRTLSKLALRVFFTDSALKKVVDLEEYEQDIQIFRNLYRKDFFIDGFGEDEIPVFSHKTYAEFLCARWLANTVKKQINCETLSDTKKILQTLYCKELTTVRLFFDSILTKELPGHSSIINKRFFNSVMSNSCYLAETDLLGRSITHMACGYGQRYEIQTATEVANLLRNIDEHAKVTRIDENVFLEIPTMARNVADRPDWDLHMIDFLECNFEQLEGYKGDLFLALQPARYALLSGSLIILDYFLKCHENNVVLQQISEDNKYFLLYHCIQNNFINILTQLDISSIDNINYIKIDSSHMSLLHLAVASRNVSAIIELTKSISIVDWGLDNEGNTPLHIACDQNKNNVPILNKLIGTKGINTKFLNLKNNEGYSHLHTLAYRNQAASIKKIIKKFPDIDVDSPCNAGNTPFMVSIIYNKIKVAKILYTTHKVDVNHQNIKGLSALHYSSSRGYVTCTKKLVHWKAKIDCTDSYSLTPLMKASGRGHTAIVDVLLKSGAKVNLYDISKWTALHYAAKRNKDSVVQSLLNANANLNWANKRGHTPAMTACEYDAPEVLRLLIMRDADLKMSNRGQKALQIARSKGHSRCVDLILQADNV